MQLSDIATIGLVALLAIVIGYAVVGDNSYITEKPSEVGETVVPAQNLETLPNLGKAGRLIGILDWINTEPLADSDLRGRVVLVDFWTYSCINCIRTLPFVQGWHEKYKDDGFILLGVHSPEFEFEKDVNNIQAAVDQYGLTYPIAVDSNRRTWDSFKNRFWPAHYLLDVDGNIRFVHFGEGKYAETEAAIHNLLVEAGLRSTEEELVIPEETISDELSVRTAETYLGFERLNNFGDASEDILANEPYEFVRPAELEADRFYLDGQWSIHAEFAQTTSENGGVLVYQYQGKEVNIVADSSAEVMEVEVLLDGAPLPAEKMGADVVRRANKTYAVVKESKLYNIVADDKSGEHVLELLPPSAGLRVFTFTFG